MNKSSYIDMAIKWLYTKPMSNAVVRNLNVRFPFDLLDALRKAAKQDQRSLNSQIIWILRTFVEQRAKKSE